MHQPRSVVSSRSALFISRTGSHSCCVRNTTCPFASNRTSVAGLPASRISGRQSAILFTAEQFDVTSFGEDFRVHLTQLQECALFGITMPFVEPRAISQHASVFGSLIFGAR